MDNSTAKDFADILLFCNSVTNELDRISASYRLHEKSINYAHIQAEIAKIRSSVSMIKQLANSGPRDDIPDFKHLGT